MVALLPAIGSVRTPTVCRPFWAIDLEWPQSKCVRRNVVIAVSLDVIKTVQISSLARINRANGVHECEREARSSNVHRRLQIPFKVTRFKGGRHRQPIFPGA
jgi:hypothetical protein